MEIVLQGHSTYQIKDWAGTVEVSSLNLAQLKRLSSSRNTLSLFRKFLKILNSKNSPVELPKDLVPEDLDIGDFMQLLIGLIAASKGRQFQKTYTCTKCKALQPRVIDIIKVFKPKAPIIEGGSKELEVFGGKTLVTIKNVLLKDFLFINSMLEALESLSVEDQIAKVKTDYKDIFEVEDEEDLDDFKEFLLEVGLIASKIDIRNSEQKAEETEASSFNEKLAFVSALQGDNLKIYQTISETVLSLSPSITTSYKTECTNCKEKIVEKVEPTSYFFGSAWISSLT